MNKAVRWLERNYNYWRINCTYVDSEDGLRFFNVRDRRSVSFGVVTHPNDSPMFEIRNDRCADSYTYRVEDTP